jgi:hypothetical protein
MKANAFRIADRERRKRRVVEPSAVVRIWRPEDSGISSDTAGKPGKMRAGGFPKRHAFGTVSWCGGAGEGDVDE